MAKNQELKFLSSSVQVPDELLRSLGVSDKREYFQEDVYALNDTHFFKLRINDHVPAKLLRYKRLTSPVLRDSNYEAHDLADESARKAALFVFENVMIAGKVKKRRRQFTTRDMILNFDVVFHDDGRTVLYQVIEIEYFKETREGGGEAVQRVLKAFNVKSYELLPYSNIHMVNMIKKSEQYRIAFSNGVHVGRLILIDGGSATGKSTIKNILADKYQLGYAPRDTTRASRQDDLVTHDYNFISRSDFNLRALAGEYIEFRDFLFDMSYGLRWMEFVGALLRGQDMMALINLGNGYFTKRLLPEAKLVLLYADIEVIEARLRSRGTMSENQIEERLENNRLAVTYREAYDRAIDTGRFRPEEVAERIFCD